MHEEATKALHVAIPKAGAIFQPLVAQLAEPHLVYCKTQSGWRGQYQLRPNVSSIVGHSFQAQGEAAAEFTDLLRRHHPELAGMVGLAGFGQFNLLHDTSYILRGIMITLWHRHGTFQPSAEATEAVIQEFTEFVDRDRVRLRYTAPLLNYTMTAEMLALSNGVCLRRLSEDEINKVYGGSVWQLGMMPNVRRGMMINEFAVEGECDAIKMYGTGPSDSSVQDTIRGNLDSIIMALRTFKDGRVGTTVFSFDLLNFVRSYSGPWVSVISISLSANTH